MLTLSHAQTTTDIICGITSNVNSLKISLQAEVTGRSACFP